MTGEVGKTRGATTNATGACQGQRSEERSSSLSEVPSEADSLLSLSSTGSTTGDGTQTRGSTNEWEQCYRAMDERRELTAARPRRCCSRGLGEKNPISLGYASSFYSRTRPVNSTSDWAETTKPVEPPSTH